MIPIDKLEFRGVATINPVAFTESGDVNEDEYCRHVEFMVRGGVQIIMPVGHVASGIQLSEAERLRVIEITVGQVGGRKAVFPCCYQPAGTRNTISYINEIEGLGVDGAYVPTPDFWQCSREAVYQHYREILANTTLPLIVYSCPITSGTALPSDVVVMLLDEFPGRILGYKQQLMEDLPFDIMRLADRINLAPTCWDRYILAGLRLGCRAQISIGGALVPDVLCTIFEMWEAGDQDGAAQVFDKYLPFFNIPATEHFFVHRDYYAGVYFYMLNRMGFQFGRPRLPYLWPIPDDMKREVDGQLDALNLVGAYA